ncbi:MAG: HNH endonuclease signature motif containing protein [Candidatus Micrarchaeota archaeon]
MGRPAKQLPDKTCGHCGRVFNRKRFGNRLEDASRYLTRKFCSLNCSGFREELIDPKSTHLLNARKLKKKYCEECGTTSRLEVHHINGKVSDNRKENIKTLCSTCHMKLHWRLRKRGIVFGEHRKYSEMRKAGLMERKSAKQSTEQRD